MNRMPSGIGQYYPLLQEVGASPRFRRYDFHPGGGTADAARQLGIDPKVVVKTLIFIDRGADGPRPIGVLVPGTMRVSVRRLEKISDTSRLVPASPYEVEAVPGCRVGGVSPFDLAGTMPLFAQQCIRSASRIVINAGERGLVIDMTPVGLTALPLVWADVAARGGSRSL